MSREEYKELIRDPFKFLIEKITPRVYRNLSKQNTPQYLATLIKLDMESQKWLNVSIELNIELRRMGYPIMLFSLSTVSVDYIADNLRCPHNHIMNVRFV